MRTSPLLGIVLAVLAGLAVGAPVPAKKKAPAPEVDLTSQAVPMAKENRIVRYTYSPDVIFRVFTRPTLHTHIELGEDEGLKEKPVLGDTLEWSASGGPRNIYIKPRHDGIETSMTVVTNKRVYQFQLIAGNREEASPLYQKVSFDFPDRDAEIKMRQDVEVARESAEIDRLSAQIVTPNADPAALNFDFKVEGTAPFKPTSVYTDSKFTYLRLPNVQDTPVVFLLDDANNPSLINYKVKDNLIIIERVASKLLLKIGSAEVIVTARDASKPNWR
jgi:P-type conjugative transfer protein VirB9